MTIPIGGIRRPVTIVDCNGNEVTITNGRLDVNAVVNVAGDQPQAFEAQQDLSAGPLDETDAIVVDKEALWLALHLDAPLANEQTFSIRFKSATGAAFDTLILSEPLAAGTEDKYYAFPCKTLLRGGDHIQVELTNAGGETATASLTLMFGV